MDEWGKVIDRFDNPSGVASGIAKNGEIADDILRYMSDLRVEDSAAKEHVHDHSCSGSHAVPVQKPRNPELYHCSWCHNPSAVLRKCSGCGTTRHVQILDS